MARLGIDLEVSDTLAKADADPDAAALALKQAAIYLRAREALPDALIEHLAGAIEAAMDKPVEHRCRALLLELKLTAENRRPTKANCVDVGLHIEAAWKNHPGRSQNAVMTDAGRKFGISRASALRLWKQYRDALAINRAATLVESFEAVPSETETQR